MELNTKSFSLAALVAAVLLYIVCVIFVVAAPSLAIKILGGIIHTVNVSQFMEASVTFSGVMLGIIPVLIYSYFGALIFASVYNKFVRK